MAKICLQMKRGGARQWGSLTRRQLPPSSMRLIKSRRIRQLRRNHPIIPVPPFMLIYSIRARWTRSARGNECSPLIRSAKHDERAHRFNHPDSLPPASTIPIAGCIFPLCRTHTNQTLPSYTVRIFPTLKEGELSPPKGVETSAFLEEVANTLRRQPAYSALSYRIPFAKTLEEGRP